MQLTGIHHLTAISSDIRENFHFYTQVLGMRLVKRSVNQDDVRAYHLFYADAAGSAGTDLTFFDWQMPKEKRGNHSITRTYLRVKGEETLVWWKNHLTKNEVQTDEISLRDNRLCLDFEDGEGQRLALVDDGGEGESGKVWERSPVPSEHQIRGLGPIVMSVPNLSKTDLVLTSVMNMHRVREYSHPEDVAHTVHVYQMNEGGPHAELHVAVQPGLPFASSGAGGVHHVAFRTPDEESYHLWTEHLSSRGIRHSGEIDRHYFRSLYFREPNGILFEIATDGPGFAVDEDAATLGEKVTLPPFLEWQREAILAGLKPLD